LEISAPYSPTRPVIGDITPKRIGTGKAFSLISSLIQLNEFSLPLAVYTVPHPRLDCALFIGLDIVAVPLVLPSLLSLKHQGCPNKVGTQSLFCVNT
jgi:hypothetical protein